MPPRPRGFKINRVVCGAQVAALACLLLMALNACLADDTPNPELLSFGKAVDLALQHSGVMGIATLEQWRSQKVYQELHDNYIPQLTIGSGLGYAYGFPLTLEGTAPSLANFTSTQALFNPALKQFMKAAKIDWNAASHDVQDKRNAVILDTALTYAQLEQLIGKIKALTEAQAAADKAQVISEQRLLQGVDTKLELTKSQLMAARIRLRIAEAQGQTDVLRDHLSKLIGLPAESIAVEAGSMPQLPPVSQDDNLSARAVENSPLVKLADQKAAAAEARAKGEHKAATWATVDVATQYAYLARYNNWDVYFKNYLANNFSGGLNIRFPIFNSVQKAKAGQADADAMVARKQADLTRNRVGEDTLKLQRSLRQLAAARDVAKLEWEVAQGEMEAVAVRVETGGANTRDQANARLDVDDKHAAFLDAEFELCRAELQLLRLTGELENWAIPPR
jgi:outer membrane protein TolC